MNPRKLWLALTLAALLLGAAPVQADHLDLVYNVSIAASWNHDTYDYQPTQSLAAVQTSASPGILGQNTSGWVPYLPSGALATAAWGDPATLGAAAGASEMLVNYIKYYHLEGLLVAQAPPVTPDPPGDLQQEAQVSIILKNTVDYMDPFAPGPATATLTIQAASFTLGLHNQTAGYCFTKVTWDAYTNLEGTLLLPYVLGNHAASRSFMVDIDWTYYSGLGWLGHGEIDTQVDLFMTQSAHTIVLPLPGSLIFLGSGLAGLASLSWRRWV